jgi:hypothetical protein
MAEAHLGELPAERWQGLRFRWSENVTGGMWASVTLEIERRGDQWIVTRLDRSPTALAREDTGFQQLPS